MFHTLLPLQGQVNYTPYNFTTIAGRASIGSDDGTNSAARFNFPEGVVTDASNNIYVVDSGSSTIRKVSPSGTNWVVTTIAGTHNMFGTTDGPGSQALFHQPDGITMDAAGALYVTDSQNYTIRKLTFNGSVWMVSTIAGSPGLYGGNSDGTNSDGTFTDPEGICIDAAGNLFVTDETINEIREISPSGTNWVVSTIAGQYDVSGSADGMNTNATFNDPFGITVDKNENLFVGDAFNYVIRKISPSGTNWTTTTIAGQLGVGNGLDGIGTNAAFEYTTGLFADAGSNVYVADAEDASIRKLTPSGTNYSVSTPVGMHRLFGYADGTNNNATFNFPFDVTLDKNGDLIISDNANSEIRKATPSGTNWVVTSLAGFAMDNGSADGSTGVSRLSQPFGIAVDASSNVFVADYANSTIRKLTRNGASWTASTVAGQANSPGYSDAIGTNAYFGFPTGMAVDASGYIYVFDGGNEKLRRLIFTNGNYLVTSLAGEYGTAGTNDGTNFAAQFNTATALAVDAATNIFVADCNNSIIRKVTPQGTNWVVTTIAGTAGVYNWAEGTGKNSVFNYPRGVAVDKNGVVYVADSGNNLIRTLTPSGTNYVSATIAGQVQVNGHTDGTNLNATFYYPTDIAIDNSGVLYVADYDNATIRKLVHTGTNWVVTTMAGIPSQLGSTDGAGAAALFDYPVGIAVDKSGAVYVSEQNNSTVVMGVAEPVIVITQPVIASGHLQIPFLVENGSPATFKLLQAGALGSAWTTNAAAVLTTNVPGTTYQFTITQPGTNQFYRVQTP